MRHSVPFVSAGWALIALLLAGGISGYPAADKPAPPDESLDWQVPDGRVIIPFQDDRPILFVNRSQNPKEWDRLAAFWNDTSEKTIDPRTGQNVGRKAVKIKVPLGLTRNPPVPPENPITVAKWALGKQLYFDPILSSDGTVSCATCHDPRKGFTDQARVSTGINGNKGGVSAPTVLNSAYNPLQFWDGRAGSLEEQAQGPPQNPLEMFDGQGNAWHKLVQRVRTKDAYVRQFRTVFGTEPTRDAIAKALATYERTVLCGNSLHDRAELAMRRRVDDEESGKYVLQAKDYEAVLKEAFAKNDGPAMSALGVDPAKDAARVPELAQRIHRGHELFFNKARCNSCHVGDNFTDNAFHNLGVGIKGDESLLTNPGRFGPLPTGHKDAEALGAFKTPTLRGLLNTAPYMHDGGEATLEAVVDFYDKGGQANEFLDPKMRNFEAEKAYELSRRNGTAYEGPEVKLFGKDRKPIVPLPLHLTRTEEADLVLFLRALQGDPVDPIVSDRRKQP